MSTLQTILSQLRNVKQIAANQWQACCPAHEDNHPSLCISVGRSRQPLLYCHAGCSFEAIRDAVGLSRVNGKALVAEYDYVNEHGELLYQKLRYSPKEFRQRRPDGNGNWLWNLNGVARALYRLPDVRKAIDAGEVVYIVEGEKDADRLHRLGITATTNPEGAAKDKQKPKWRQEYTEQLRGAQQVVLLPDNDSAGRAHMQAVAKALAGVVPDIRLVELPGLPAKGDVSDWLNAGHSADDLERLASTSESYRDHTMTKVASTVTDFYAKHRPTSAQLETPSSESASDGWPLLTLDDKPPHVDTDLSNSYRLASYVGRDLLYVVNQGWHVWDGTHWARGEEFAYGKAKRLSRLILAEAAAAAREAANCEDDAQRKTLTATAEALTKWARSSESQGKIEAAMALTRSALAIRSSQLDNDPWLLNCSNGSLDLKTGTLRPHQRSDFITRVAPVDYHPDATCPTWLGFLDRIFAGNAELIHFIQKAVGYSLTGSIREQCIFIPHGTGANGKSTFLDVLQTLLGPYAQQGAPDLLLACKQDKHPTELAELRGARMVTSIETGENRRLNENRVKQVSGGDRVRARFMGKDFFEFTPEFKLWLATNHKPVIRGTDHAIWRRIRLLPFNVTIPEEERDPDLALKLKTELPGILAWAVQGCLAWQQEGLKPPQAVRDATESYRAEMDVLAAFLAEHCVTERDCKAKASDLYRTYTSWCETNGEQVQNQRSFGMRLTERGFERFKVRGTSWWRGIGLTQVDDVDHVDELLISPIDKSFPEDKPENWSTSSTSSTQQTTFDNKPQDFASEPISTHSIHSTQKSGCAYIEMNNPELTENQGTKGTKGTELNEGGVDEETQGGGVDDGEHVDPGSASSTKPTETSGTTGTNPVMTRVVGAADAADAADAKIPTQSSECADVDVADAAQGEYLGKAPDIATRMASIRKQADRAIERQRRLVAEKKAVARLVAAQPSITLDNVVIVSGLPYQQAAAALERAKLAGLITVCDGRWYPIPNKENQSC